MTETSQQLKIKADEAKAEFHILKAEVDAIPEQLAEIDRRLNTATDIKVIKTLRAKRAELSEDSEIKPLLLRGARIRALRAESAYIRGLQKEVGAGHPSAVQAEKDAKAELESAKIKLETATAERIAIERRDSHLNFQWQGLAAEAEAWESGRESTLGRTSALRVSA